MDYVFASFISDLKQAWASKETNDVIVSTVLNTLAFTDNPYQYSVDSDTASLYLRRKRNLKKEVVEAATVPVIRKNLPERFEAKVVSELAQEKIKDLTHTISYHVNQAVNFPSGAKSAVSERSRGSLAIFLSTVFECVLRVDNKVEKEEPETASVPLTNYAHYLDNIKESFSTAKTILHQDMMLPFYDLYVCNDIWIAKRKTPQQSILTRIPIRFFSIDDEYGETDRRYSGELLSSVTAKTLLDKTDRVILRGTGGIGKSMMMRHLLMSAIEETDGKYNIPVMIPLKDYHGKEELKQFIIRTVCQYTNDISAEDVIRDFEYGRFLFLLDGLDEIPTKDRSHFENELSQFVNTYRGNAFVMTSRPISDFVEFSQFSVATLRPLTKQQALQLVDRLYYRPDDPQVKAKFAKALDERLYDSHCSFASNPLLLNFMLMTFERYADVPAKMHKFYEKAYEVLAETHDASKGAYIRTFETGFDADKMEDYLAEFCARTYMDEKYDLPVRKAREYYNIMAVKEDDGQDAPKFPAFMRDVCDNLCLMYRESDVYHFMHRSFQEYFCALFFSHQHDEDLQDICEEFDNRRFLHGSDTVFEMLYDMIPEKILRFAFYPLLKSIFSDENSGDGFWTFLEKAYGRICYSCDETGGRYEVTEPMLFLYRFMIIKLGLVESYTHDFNDKDFPCIEEWVESRFFKVTSYDDDEGTITEILPDYEISEDVPDSRTEYIGSTVELPIEEIKRRIPEDDDPECIACDDEYAAVIKTLLEENCTLRQEYRTLQSFYHRLRDRYEAPKKKSGKLFDRIRH